MKTIVYYKEKMEEFMDIKRRDPSISNKKILEQLGCSTALIKAHGAKYKEELEELSKLCGKIARSKARKSWNYKSGGSKKKK